ncbi:hypothetical protein NQ317_003766 [Molorchus minor]|uniref:endo-polygalacturonase n=1 Tax=Molorchus minor TaxID=1323400 RepID=A0ABQ9J184_9CUCU|nr:hypothetical protein NQ317_003766 [Molorchus minor]
MTVFYLLALTIVAAVSASSLNETNPRASCTVTSYDQVADALTSCSEIVISGIQVPASTTLKLSLNDGAKLTFDGRITFGHAEWSGPLISVSGKGVTVEGATGHRLDGEGALYWDGLGGSGNKPVFFRIQASGTFSNINLLNCPERCHINRYGWNIDVSDGDTQGGHNTDGFDISSSNNVVIKNSVVRNQDDCIAVNYGTNLVFNNLYCTGSHGLSLSVGLSKTDPSTNVVSNVTFSDSTVENSANAITLSPMPMVLLGILKMLLMKTSKRQVLQTME